MNSNTNLAVVFPGQGSQAVGMGKNLADAFPEANEIFLKADHILGFPLSKIAWEGPEEELNDTANTQPALYVHSYAVWKVLQSLHPEFQPAYMAGHSLGEFTALAAAGAVSFSEGLKLVRTRGELMREAGVNNPGSIAAILGLELDQVEKITREASSGSEVVTVANDNCPGQVVISGSRAGVEKAVEMAKAAGAKRAMPLNVSVAVHSELMAQAQSGLVRAIANTSIVTPQVPVIGNVSAHPLESATDVRQEIQLQLTSRVRWTETVQFLLSKGVTRFIELGNGSVLSGLIRRIDKNTTQSAIGAPADFETYSA